MKKFKQIVLFFLLVSFLAYAGLWSFVNIRGRDLLAKIIERQASLEVFIDKVEFRPLLGVSAQGISFEGAEVGNIDIQLNILSLLSGKLRFKKIGISDADLEIVNTETGIKAPLGISIFSSSSGGRPSRKEVLVNRPGKQPGQGGSKKRPLEEKKSRIPIVVDELGVKDAKVTYRYPAKDIDSSLIIKKLDVFNFAYPLNNRFSFILLADTQIGPVFSMDNIKARGWLDFRSRSMDTLLEIKSLPYKTLSLYLPSFWKADNLGIEAAILSLNADFEAVNNDLTIKGDLALVDYKLKDTTGEDSTKMAVTKAIINMFKKGKDYPRFDFLLKTKFDSPRLDFSTITSQVKTDTRGAAAEAAKEVIKGIVEKPHQAAGRILDLGKESANQAANTAVDVLERVIKTPKKARNIVKTGLNLLLGDPQEETDGDSE